MTPSQYAMAAHPEMTLDLLHRREGRVCKDKVRKMQRLQLADGIECPPETCRIPRDPCELGRKRRASFPPAVRAGLSSCNDVIHSDISGPTEVLARNGSRYVLLFVDMWSRYNTVYLLHERSEFVDQFAECKSLVETHHNRSIERLISNNGSAYLDDRLDVFCRTTGIKHETTTADTPEQNGLAEVRFRVLFGMVRTMLIASSAPKQL